MNENIKESIKWMLVVNDDPSKNLSRIDGEPYHQQTIEELAEFNREKLLNLCELLGYEDLANGVCRDEN